MQPPPQGSDTVRCPLQRVHGSAAGAGCPGGVHHPDDACLRAQGLCSVLPEEIPPGAGLLLTQVRAQPPCCALYGRKALMLVFRCMPDT